MRFFAVSCQKNGTAKHFGESRFVDGNKASCGVIFILLRIKTMSGGFFGGLILALLAGVIVALGKRYPTAMTIIIRTILGLIFATLIGGVIYLLINPPK